MGKNLAKSNSLHHPGDNKPAACSPSRENHQDIGAPNSERPSRAELNQIGNFYMSPPSVEQQKQPCNPAKIASRRARGLYVHASMQPRVSHNLINEQKIINVVAEVTEMQDQGQAVYHLAVQIISNSLPVSCLEQMKCI